MPVELKFETNVVVFLPSNLEFDKRLEAILDECFNQGANESCVIGPTVTFNNSSVAEAEIKVRRALKKFKII
jgi:hypothetical protein